MDKVNVNYRVDERLTIRSGYNRKKKKKKKKDYNVLEILVTMHSLHLFRQSLRNDATSFHEIKLPYIASQIGEKAQLVRALDF